MSKAKRIISTILAAALLVSSVVTGLPVPASAAAGESFTNVGGWFETIYAEISGIKASDVTGVTYNDGTKDYSLNADDLTYLVRDYGSGVRVDIPGVRAGTYSLTVSTAAGNYTQSGISVMAYDRSGYAHYNYTAGVGAYNDDGTLKENAIVLYVTDSNKDTVTVTSKDGTTVTGIGHILNSAGEDNGADPNDGIYEKISGGKTVTGKANKNAGIIKKLAEDGTPLVVRIVGNVTAPDGVTAYDSLDYGGSVGDNGYMVRMKSGLNITIEGIGSDATMNGWGIHFMCVNGAPNLGKSFEVRNITFRNVPEDCIGIEGVQDDSTKTITASADHCWVHNCSFYAPSIANPAESDKAGGDGACDFKRGEFFTMSYCYYEGYHKTNLVGSSDTSLQYNITWHHNYWKNCESRGPLGRQANMHIYNCIYEGQSSYAMNPRANCYIFSEYNTFNKCKNPVQVKSGAVKSYHDTFTACSGDNNATIVTDKNQKVDTSNKFANFDTDSSLSYIPSGNYQLQTSSSEIRKTVFAYAGAQKTKIVTPDEVNTAVIPTDYYPKAAVVLPYDKDLNKTYVNGQTTAVVDNIVFHVKKAGASTDLTLGNASGCDIVFYVNVPVNITVTDGGGSSPVALCTADGETLFTGTGSKQNLPAGYYMIQSGVYETSFKEAKISHLKIEAYDPNATPVEPTQPTPTTPDPTDPNPTDPNPTNPNPTVPVEGSYVHNFTTDGKTNSFFSITGNLSSSKGTVTYNGLTLTQCLKMESSTNISFTAPASGKLTLVFGGSAAAAGKTVKLDGTKQTVGSDETVTLDVAAGAHTVTKGESINLFYMVYTPDNIPHTHSYTPAVTKEATCTETGVMTYTCSCGDTYTEEIPAKGHDWNTDYTVDVQPTDTTPGSKSIHCKNCDAKKDVQEIPPHTHTYDAGAVTKEPTCYQTGIKTFTCTSCGASYTEEIPATGNHVYSDTYTVDKQPTTTEEGSESRHCTTPGCTAHIDDRAIPVIDVGQDSAGITESAGHLESAYVKWSPVEGATGYRVYVKEATAADSTYVRLDNMLIRGYNGYFRADALGLKAGKYILKVVPIANGSEDTGKAMFTKELTVLAHDRSGYAFVNGTSSGAYNDDGTLKSNAVVVYVTNENKDTVTATLSGAGTLTGLQNIVAGAKDATQPLCVRLIGSISVPSTSMSGNIEIKENAVPVTIEGVGEDATANGWGIRLMRASNAEVRNIGFMNNSSGEGDNVNVESCDHVWVHNCDMFYGTDRGGDKQKGDGALDTKKSHYVTHSYNHFWDSGKCNLQGSNSSDTSDYITYHHNWYDHSDSRHPRVRVAHVHVYNNFYDGNAKYGIGATTGSDVFSESNYFLNCKYPMMISEQGSDLISGGTFSGEAGGMIKAYGNVIIGATSFIPNSEQPTNFDAVVVANRNDTVPSTYKTVSGGNTYDNFDTKSDFYTYEAQTAEEAMNTVKVYAGRMNGGDFHWTFTDADNEDYSRNAALDTALKAYKDKIVSIGGVSDGSDPVDPDPVDPTDPNPTDPDPTDPNPTDPTPTVPVAGSYVHNFTTDGKTNSFFSITGNLSSSKGTVTYNGLTLTQCLKMESSTNISFTAPADGKLTLVFGGSAAAAGKTVKLDGTKQTVGSDETITLDVAAGAHTVTKGESINLFYMVYTPNKVACGISGSITSAGTEPITVELLSGGSVVATVSAANGAYSFADVADGTYTLRFTQTGMVSAECEVTVSGASVTKNVTLYRQEDLVTIAHSLDLQGEIGVRYYLALTEGVTNPTMTAWRTETDRVENVPGTLLGSEYLFVYNVYAMYMADDITAQFTMEKDGVRYTMNNIYSVQEYCEHQLQKATIAADSKDLFAKLLNYGAYAQLYFGYRTDSLANANLAALGYAVTLDTSAVSAVESTLGTDFAGPVKGHFNGNTLLLEEVLGIRYYMVADEAVGDVYMAYRVQGTNQWQYVKAELTPNGNEYYATISNIVSYDIKNVYEAYFCEKTGDTYTQITQVKTYGAEMYAYKKLSGTNENLRNCVIALMMYADAAKVHFGK